MLTKRFNDVGEALEHYLGMRNLGVRELAEKSKTSYISTWRATKSKGAVPLKHVHRWAKALHLDDDQSKELMELSGLARAKGKKDLKAYAESIASRVKEVEGLLEEAVKMNVQLRQDLEQRDSVLIGLSQAILKHLKDTPGELTMLAEVVIGQVQPKPQVGAGKPGVNRAK